MHLNRLIYLATSVLFAFISCDDDITDRRYRNENYVFYQEAGKKGEWLKMNRNSEFQPSESFTSYFFPNGNRYGELEVLDSFPNRIVAYYDIEDSLTKTETYKDNNLTKKQYRNGYIKEYYSNLGNVKYEGGVFSNLEQGEWKRYRKNGSLLRKFYKEDGLNHGERIDYYETGEIESVSNWHKDEQVGIARTYYKSGKIKIINYTKNKEVHGEYLEYYENEQVMRLENFWNGERIDTCKYYHEDGQLRMVQVYDLDTISMLSSGTQMTYYPSGKLKGLAEFKNNHAGITLYHENGIISQISKNLNNIREGDFKTFYKSGQLECKGKFRKGLYHGKFEFFNESGKLTKIINFEFNVAKDSTIY
jgi:antitoxin component YwqK of YwqJK toxin-antitoxin module